MKYSCGYNNKRPLTPADFEGLGLNSQIDLKYLPFVHYNSNYCTKCKCIFNKVYEKTRYAKIMNQWYFFCDDTCWSNWCQSLNTFK